MVRELGKQEMKNEYDNANKAYNEILSLIDKHKDIIIYRYDELKQLSEKHLFGLELKEKYRLDINPREIYSLDSVKLGEFITISRWGKKYNRTISYPDNGKQPENELLLYIGFPTGAYILGDNYPEELFYELWQELKLYNPKYLDTINHALFYSMDSANEIFNKFPEIINKYRQKNKVISIKMKIEKLNAEMELMNNVK